MIHLKDRSIIEITGDDRKNFLQGLITNDINKINDAHLIYTLMLNAQGRFLYDFFIFEKDEKLFLDCYAARRDEIFTKLNFYKLRAKVQIIKNDNLIVANNFQEDARFFSDPRDIALGFRGYLPKSELTELQNDSDSYNYCRISLKIPESEQDLTYEKSIANEFGFDNLNAIDYKKGCYVGQELTARTHYMGQIRKKIFHIILPNLTKIEKNHEIACEGKSAGIILSSVFFKNNLHALALIKIEDIDLAKCEVDGNKIEIVN